MVPSKDENVSIPNSQIPTPKNEHVGRWALAIGN
jgi:hypothetical protein